jgi:hypothetical protein
MIHVLFDLSIMVLYVPDQPESKVFCNGFTVFFLEDVTDIMEKIFGVFEQAFMLCLVTGVLRKTDIAHHLFLVGKVLPRVSHERAKGMPKQRRVLAVVQSVYKVLVIGDQIPMRVVKAGDARRQVMVPYKCYVGHRFAYFFTASSRRPRSSLLEQSEADLSPGKRRTKR